jgi:hypothetical protein
MLNTTSYSSPYGIPSFPKKTLGASKELYTWTQKESILSEYFK